MTNLSASDLAGRHVRQARLRRGWTAAELAARCAKTGAPQLSSTVITNIETRRRASRQVAIDELLILARVLEIHPVQLIVPLDASEHLEVLPGDEMDALEAVTWIGGGAIPLHDRELASSAPEETANLLRHLDHGGVLNIIRLTDRAIRLITREDEMLERDPELAQADAGTWRLRLLADRLMHLAAHMEALGYDPPGPGAVREILQRRGLPSTLEEWRGQPGADGEGDADGTGS
jgi:transcriptional regulator with XRE-family HTH domain